MSLDLTSISSPSSAILTSSLWSKSSQSVSPSRMAPSPISVIDNDAAPAGEISRASMGTSWLRRAAMSSNRRY